MPPNPDQSSPNWRGGKGTPQRKLKKQEWQQPGQPIISSDGLGRRLKVAGLLGGVFVCVAGIILLVMWLRAPHPPLFVIVANPPSVDAANMDVPLDFYGWRGANQLADWVADAKSKEDKGFLSKLLNLQNAPNQMSDTNKPVPLKADPKDLVGSIELHAKDTEYVFAYFGVFGSVNDKGEPFLFTTEGGTLTVRALLNELQARKSLAKTKIILCFDAARLRYAPRLAVLHNDFAHKIKEVYKDVKPGNIVTLVSSKEDELAWDSEQAGSSVFLMQLMQAMEQVQGKSINLQDLFDTLKKRTVAWTKERCITEQTPMMLPESDDIKKMTLPTIAAELPKPRLGSLSDGNKESSLSVQIKAQHQDAFKLARLVPGPEVYTPLRWRYYRELLNRWERAGLAHDEECATKLAALLELVKKQIETDRALVAGKSQHTTLSMKAFLTGNYDVQSRQAEDPAQIKPMDEVPFKKPVEAHFAQMAKQFFEDTGVKPDEELLGKAIQVRQAAENAALSLVGGEKLYPYSERLWPLIHDKIVAADVLRRQGEDLLFASGDKQRADTKQLLEEALKGYQDANANVVALQDAWRTYHYAASVLPDLLQWRSDKAVLDNKKASQSDVYLQPYIQCCDAFRLLHDKLKDINKENMKTRMETITQATRETREKLKTLLADYRQIIDEKCRTREEKYSKDCVLNVPFLIDIYKSDSNNLARLEAMKGARKLGDEFYGSNTTSAPAALDIQFNKLAQQRIRLMYALLKPSEKDKITSITLEDLSRHYEPIKALGNDMPVDGKDSEKLMEYEANSRLALSLRAPKSTEPAVQWRTIQWNQVLREQALRFALDHWYRGDKQPYFKELAETCLADVKPVNGAVETPDTLLKQILSAEPLELQAIGLRQANRLIWTSEQEQELKFNLARIPPVKGSIAAWPVLQKKNDKSALQIKNNQDQVRQPRELKTKDMDQLVLPLQLAEKEINSRDENVKVTQHVYFRGQRLAQAVDVNLFRQPSRVVTWQKPTEEASFVVNSTGDLGVGLGHLAIVLDYSGSMRYYPDGKIQKYLDNWNDKATRKLTRMYKAIEELNRILADLPDQTSISIRVFSDTESCPKGIDIDNTLEYTNNTRSWQMFTGTLLKGNDQQIRLAGKLHKSLKDATGYDTTIDKDKLIEQLHGLEPIGYTPLLQSIRDCIKNDAQGGAATTFLILTDGMDTSIGKLEEEKDEAVKDGKKTQLRDAFNSIVTSTENSIHLVFMETNDVERPICESVFKLPNDSPNQFRVSVYYTNMSELHDRLRYALRPRVRLLRDGVPVFENKHGWEVSKKDTKIDKMKCTPKVAPGTNYELTLGSEKSSGRQGQAIGLREGEFMFLELSEKGPGKVQITRKLFKDVFIHDKDSKEQQNVKVTSELAPWHLCLAENQDKLGAADGQKYRSFVMTLENGRALQAEGGRLQLIKPEQLTWWDIEFRDASLKPLPKQQQPRVQVRNITRYFAPAWEIHFDEIDKDAEHMFVNIWPEREDTPEPPLKPIELKKCKGDPIKYAGKYQVRCFHVSNYLKYDARFARDSANTEALAVQVQMVPEQPFSPIQLELAGAGQSVKYIEHVYYQDARSVTVYFCGISKDEFDKLDESAVVNLVTMKPATQISMKLNRQEAMKKVIGNTMLGFGSSKSN